jgi:hypothetical protein
MKEIFVPINEAGSGYVFEPAECRPKRTSNDEAISFRVGGVLYGNCIVPDSTAEQCTNQLAVEDIPAEVVAELGARRAYKSNAYFVPGGGTIPDEAAATVHRFGPDGKTPLPKPQIDNDEWPSVEVAGGRVYRRPGLADNLTHYATDTAISAMTTKEVETLCARPDERLSQFIEKSTATLPKAALKVGLLSAVARGLAPDTAEALRVKHVLPTGAQKDGIDAEIHEAATVHIMRFAGFSRDSARGLVSACLSESAKRTNKSK